MGLYPGILGFYPVILSLYPVYSRVGIELTILLVIMPYCEYKHNHIMVYFRVY